VVDFCGKDVIKIAIPSSSSALQFIHQNGVHGHVRFFLPADEGAHPGDGQMMIGGAGGQKMW
jgi:hypothetical protein